jgi:YidC/Oxa1 family membrane protein insertase
MDKNTLMGLGLIGAILVAFTYFNKPSEAELKAQRDKEKKAQIEQQKEIKEDQKKAVDAKTVKLGSSAKKAVIAFKEEILPLESDKMKVEVSTKGGVVSSVYLKEYKTYRQFTDKKSKDCLKFVDKENNTNALVFKLNGKEVNTANLNFEVASKSKHAIVLEASPAENRTIQFVYALNEKGYDLDYEVKLDGFKPGEIAPNSVNLHWEANLSKTERLLSEQRRVSTIFFKANGEDYDYLSEASDDDETFEKKVDWVAFKQSYFSSIMKPETGFNPTKSSVKIVNFKEGHPKFSTHIKKYVADLNLSISTTGIGVAKISWFFGPNDYELLKSYNSNFEDIINYGWGLFRWINIYAIQPMFNAFAEMGIELGIVILLITLILKLFLTPIQWKMYVSSAKMRILKPEIDALNEKYPNKEDAMKKQMDMMSLYRESGASPLAGCIPMLIQMPILLAIFRFFPAAFELRQKPFLWAEDLSSYDSIFDFGYFIPLYGDHISLFTLLMSATTLVYTYINSGNVTTPQQPGMPNMKVIMYFFPVMMIFFFNNYSAGLSYYYFISTLISIIIMLAIKQFFVDEDKLKQKMAAKKMAASQNPKKKSGFAERLEQMQKAQQDRLKNIKK